MDFTRHQLRELAFQAIFSMLYQEEPNATNAIEHALELFMEEKGINQIDDVPMYLEQVIAGIQQHQEEIDTLIQENLKGWKIKRIAKSDLAILRLAVYEMKYLPDVPNKVSLNEALELSKTFSDDESRRFINGVLSSVMTQVEADTL